MTGPRPQLSTHMGHRKHVDPLKWQFSWLSGCLPGGGVWPQQHRGSEGPCGSIPVRQSQPVHSDGLPEPGGPNLHPIPGSYSICSSYTVYVYIHQTCRSLLHNLMLIHAYIACVTKSHFVVYPPVSKMELSSIGAVSCHHCCQTHVCSVQCVPLGFLQDLQPCCQETVCSVRQRGGQQHRQPGQVHQGW